MTVDVASIPGLAPISLAHLDEVAALQSRVDRKYLVDEVALDALLGLLGDGWRQLEIDGCSRFRYRSTYFDTAARDLYRAAATRRRRRFKVRTRTYEQTGTCMLEVKEKGSRGRLAKHRFPYQLENRSRLTPQGRDAVAMVVGQPELAAALEPMLTTEYLRSTLVDLDTATRLTVDRDLACRQPQGGSVALRGIIIESKSPGRPGPADLALWRLGIRPVRISKFCTGAAALDPRLPANRWRRVLDDRWDRRPTGDSGRDPEELL